MKYAKCHIVLALSIESTAEYNVNQMLAHSFIITDVNKGGYLADTK
jgi:hypothetical protein